jgi:hypothetical protein
MNHLPFLLVDGNENSKCEAKKINEIVIETVFSIRTKRDCFCCDDRGHKQQNQTTLLKKIEFDFHVKMHLYTCADDLILIIIIVDHEKKNTWVSDIFITAMICPWTRKCLFL